MKKYIKIGILFISCLLGQVLIADKIDLFNFLHPMIYIFFILVLPYKIHQVVLVGLGFAVGLCMDFFTTNLGLHAMATLCIAFFRTPFLRLSLFADARGEHVRPLLKNMKLGRYLFYIVTLILVHHLIYFFAEALSFKNLLALTITIAQNVLITTVGVICIQLTFYGREKRKKTWS